MAKKRYPRRKLAGGSCRKSCKSHRHRQRGGNFKTWIKKVGHDIGRGVKKAGGFIKKYKLVSKALKAAALLQPEFAGPLSAASTGVSLLGYGHPKGNNKENRDTLYKLLRKHQNERRKRKKFF